VSISANNIGDLFLKRVAATPNRPAFLYPDGKGWSTLTWSQVSEKVKQIAAGLLSMGLQQENRCAILSSTRVDWILSDLGILMAGGATTTIYPSNVADECAYILNDSETLFCFVENMDQVAKVSSKRGALGHLRKLIVFDGEPSSDGFVVTLSKLMEEGKAFLERSADALERAIHHPTKGSLSTLVYTSGTTGVPKGVELTHDAWLYEAQAVEALNMLSIDDVQYLWLPLAHIFGKVLEMAQLQIGFVTAVDGRVEKLVENLAVVRPTFVCAVPRIFEKVYNKVVSGAQEGGGLKYKIFRWAMDVGQRAAEHRLQGRNVTGLLAMQHGLAHKLVFSKLQNRFGGRLRFFISGSAPLSKQIAEFFYAAGIPIYEGYGLTETSAGSSLNRPDKLRFGTVGVPLLGTDIRTAPEDGEILIRGRGVMRGYWKLPEATHEALDSDGWMHTGDIGVIEDGFVRITDRKKDLIKTSGGKYVAPQRLEGRLKVLCPYISQALVFGNGRNYCTALISLDPEAMGKWAQQNGAENKPYAELTRDERVRELIARSVTLLNSELASYETIKKFAILPSDLSQDAGELTASLKVKRKVVEQKYKQLLDGLYSANS
jgi:long-chain acyl-CoA synthetase